MIIIKAGCPIFKKDDVVEVNSKLKSGLGKVIRAYYPTEQPKSELAYCWKYKEPFPQIGVEFEDGKALHYNADDLLNKIVVKSNKQLHQPQTLLKTLQSLTVDYSEALRDLREDSTNGKVSLYHNIKNYKIFSLIKELFTETVFCNTSNVIELGEFDSYTYTFTSVKKGVMFRNAGLPAFFLTITVDGYASPTMTLKTSEIY